MTIDHSPTHTMVTLLYRSLQSTLEHDMVIWRMWMLAAGRNFEFKIAAKPLHIDIWLLLTAYRNSSSPYPTTLTFYDVPFSHKTCTTDR